MKVTGTMITQECAASRRDSYHNATARRDGGDNSGSSNFGPRDADRHVIGAIWNGRICRRGLRVSQFVDRFSFQKTKLLIAPAVVGAVSAEAVQQVSVAVALVDKRLGVVEIDRERFQHARYKVI